MKLVVCLLTVAAGYDAYRAGDHAKAFAIWQADAKRGDHEAQWHLALLYRDGEGVARDFVEARGWLEKAAAGGCDEARNDLGRFLLQGVGGAPDRDRAVALFERAAQTSRAAMYNLGMVHERGLGRPKNPVEAAAWYSVAALRKEQGAEEARMRVAASLDQQQLALVKARVEKLTAVPLTERMWRIGQWLLLFSNLCAMVSGLCWLVGYFAQRRATSRARAR